MNPTTPNPLDIPERHEDVTAEWLTQALRSGGVISQQVVSSFEVEPLGAERSQLSSLARITVEFNEGAESLPDSIFAKFVSRIPGNRELIADLGVFQREIDMYKNFGNTIPLNMPKLYFGLASQDSDVGVILLEEIKAISKDALPPEERTLTASEVKLALKELAKMHAKWWEDQALYGYEWLPGVDNGLRKLLYQLNDDAWPKLRAILEPVFSSEEVRICSGLSSFLTTLMSELDKMPTTLSHSDFHSGNLLWDKTGEPNVVWVLDWQLSSRGPAIVDTARFLSTGVGRANQHLVRQDYLPEYHRALIGHGVTDYGYEQFLSDYRYGLLDAVALGLAASANVSYASEDSVERTQRSVGDYVAAAADAGCGELIP